MSSNDDDSCSICLDAFGERDVYVMRPCAHKYHRQCIVGWLKDNFTCPMCRTNVQSAEKLFDDQIIDRERLLVYRRLLEQAGVQLRGYSDEGARQRMQEFYFRQLQSGKMDGVLEMMLKNPHFMQMDVNKIFEQLSPDALIVLKQLAHSAIDELSEEDIQAACDATPHNT